MNVERICGSIPTSASSTLLAEDADMADDDYDMEGTESVAILRAPGHRECLTGVCWCVDPSGDVEEDLEEMVPQHLLPGAGVGPGSSPLPSPRGSPCPSPTHGEAAAPSRPSRGQPSRPSQGTAR